MELVTEFLQQIWGACIQLLGQPFYYLGIIFVVLLYRRQIYLERKLFLTKLHSFLHGTWKTLLWGIAAGFMASLFMLLFGVVLQAEVIIWTWIIALLLILFRARFFCFAYAIGVIGVLHSIVTIFPIESDIAIVESTILMLKQLKMPVLLVIVAVVHVIEAALIRWYSPHSATPVIVHGQRGRLIGGYQIQGFWVAPLFLVVPSQTTASFSYWLGALSMGDASSVTSVTSEFGLFFSPLFSGDLWSNGFMLLTFPLVLGYSELTRSWHPKTKAKWSSNLILLYSVILFVLAIGVEYWPPLTIVASLLCIILHEAIVWWSAWKEKQQAPYFVHDNRGLLILGTIAGSPAEELGIEAGEIVRQVNGMRVTSREEMHQALNLSPAFCKLEIINLEGQSKFLQRGIYAGEHHQLGIILAPDHHTENYISMKHKSIISYLTLNEVKRFKQPERISAVNYAETSRTHNIDNSRSIED